MKNNPLVLLILDGYGIASKSDGNAIELAKKPTIDYLSSNYPHTTLEAAGNAVGMPAGENGNSEVGHLILGSGRVVYQSMVRINNSIIHGDFFTNSALVSAVNNCKNNKTRLHLLGLVGLGSVHSYIDHLMALLMFCKKQGVTDVALHLITDGRDSPPTACKTVVEKIESELRELSVGSVVTLMGRYYAMDRDLRWERTEEAYRGLTEVYGDLAGSASEAFEKNYQNGLTDEFIRPTMIGHNAQQSRIKEGDSVVFFNFRIDRPRQLTKAFVLPDFETSARSSRNFDINEDGKDFSSIARPFKRNVKFENLKFVTMTEYEPGLPVEVCFPPIVTNDCIGEVISKLGIRQYRLAESEKERFVTYYFNGAKNIELSNCEVRIIPSSKVATYDLQPQMSTGAITQELISKLEDQAFDFGVVNFASPDMVAHTGSLEATITAIENVDQNIKLIYEEIIKRNGTLVITADHGNAEELIHKGGGVDTEHSINPVPLLIINKRLEGKNIELPLGTLADVSPTLLSILGVPAPEVMTGSDLLTAYNNGELSL